MIEISINTRNMPLVRKRLKRIIKGVENTRPLMKKISIFLDQWVQQNFDTEGSKVGNWLPLQAGGRKKKGKLDISAKILRDTGKLDLSFKPFSSELNAGIGSDLPYAPTHDEGKGVPKRRILPEDRDVMVTVLKKVNQHLDRSMKK